MSFWYSVTTSASKNHSLFTIQPSECNTYLCIVASKIFKMEQTKVMSGACTLLSLYSPTMQYVMLYKNIFEVFVLPVHYSSWVHIVLFTPLHLFPCFSYSLLWIFRSLMLNYYLVLEHIFELIKSDERKTHFWSILVAACPPPSFLNSSCQIKPWRKGKTFQ